MTHRPEMHFTATKQIYSRNAYGDKIVSSTADYPCHFRDITSVNYNSDNEVALSDAMAWFMPDAPIDKDDIVKIDSRYWTVKKCNPAHDLDSGAVEFIKVYLDVYGVIS